MGEGKFHALEWLESITGIPAFQPAPSSRRAIPSGSNMTANGIRTSPVNGSGRETPLRTNWPATFSPIPSFTTWLSMKLTKSVSGVWSDASRTTLSRTIGTW